MHNDEGNAGRMIRISCKSQLLIIQLQPELWKMRKEKKRMKKNKRDLYPALLMRIAEPNE